MNGFIRLTGIGFDYSESGANLTALREVNLEICPGEPLILCGPSGSGKTTLGMIIAGLFEPGSGSVTLENSSKSLDELRQSYVFQFPENLFFEDTVAEEFFAFNETPSASPESILGELSLDYNQIRDRHPFLLSAGQGRLTAIAVQVARSPELIVFDEPTIGLDWIRHRQMREFLFRQCENIPYSILITHDLRLISTFRGKIVALNDGEIVWQGLPKELSASKSLQDKIALSDE